MSISLHQRAIQIADDLDEQASRLNIYIADPDQSKDDRLMVMQQQIALRQAAAHLRVEAIVEIVGDQAPTLDELVSAADEARMVANKISDIKKSMEVAAATITLLAAISSGSLGKLLPALKDLRQKIR
jgi:hypothetical protein